MENQEEQFNSTESFEDDSERDKKKKARILIAIEIILLILVVVLAIIFFSSRSGGNFNFFNNSNNSENINQVPDSGGINLNDDTYQFEESNNDNFDSQEPIVYRPDRGETEVMDSLRLTLPVPDQSPVSTEEQIPEGAISISGLDSGFSPSEFTVSPGEEVTLALTSKIKYPVVLTFYDENMPAISIGCGPYETRWITFTAPSQSGEYIFRNDIFGRNDQAGKMIVR